MAYVAKFLTKKKKKKKKIADITEYRLQKVYSDLGLIDAEDIRVSKIPQGTGFCMGHMF